MKCISCGSPEVVIDDTKQFETPYAVYDSAYCVSCGSEWWDDGEEVEG